MGEDDTMTAEIVVGSAAGCIAALAMAFYLVAQDMSPVFVGVFSVLCGLVLGGAAVFWARRRLQRARALGLENLSEAQGLLIWVRVRSSEKESRLRKSCCDMAGMLSTFMKSNWQSGPRIFPCTRCAPIPGWVTSGWDSHSAATPPIRHEPLIVY